MNFILTFLAAISLGGIWDFRFEENKSLEPTSRQTTKCASRDAGT